MTGDDPMPHDARQDELADLALGLLDGRRRAMLLQHVESCPRCLAEVERLTMAADRVRHLAPELEPPVGFENRLFDRVAERGSPAAAARRRRRGSQWRPRTPRARLGLVAAAALMALLGVGVGWALRVGDNPNRPAAQAGPVLEAELVGAGKAGAGTSHGEVYVSAGRPPWLTMTVKSVGVSGRVQCRITTDSGVSYLLGSFDLRDGRGTWDAALPVAADRVE